MREHVLSALHTVWHKAALQTLRSSASVTLCLCPLLPAQCTSSPGSSSRFFISPTPRTHGYEAIPVNSSKLHPPLCLNKLPGAWCTPVAWFMLRRMGLGVRMVQNLEEGLMPFRQEIQGHTIGSILENKKVAGFRQTCALGLQTLLPCGKDQRKAL